jgi:hypothetical protein
VTPPRASSTAGSVSNVRGQSTTRASGGKPVGSPGNGPGGSGAPGQLR